MEFTDQLFDPESITFKSLQRNLENELFLVYRDTGIKNISAYNFSPGSVKVNFSLVWPMDSSMATNEQASIQLIRHLNHSGGFLGRFLILMPSIEIYDEGSLEEPVTEKTRSPDFARKFEDDWSTVEVPQIPNLWSILTGMNQTTPGFVTHVEPFFNNDIGSSSSDTPQTSTPTTESSAQPGPILFLQPFDEIPETPPNTSTQGYYFNLPVHPDENNNETSANNETMNDAPPTIQLHFFADDNDENLTDSTSNLNFFEMNDVTTVKSSSSVDENASSKSMWSFFGRMNTEPSSSTGWQFAEMESTTEEHNDTELSTAVNSEMTIALTTEESTEMRMEINESTTASSDSFIITSSQGPEIVEGSSTIINGVENPERSENQTFSENFPIMENATSESSGNSTDEEFPSLKPKYEYNWNETILYWPEGAVKTANETTEDENNETVTTTAGPEYSTINVSDEKVTTSNQSMESNLFQFLNTTLEVSSITEETTFSIFTTQPDIQFLNETSETPITTEEPTTSTQTTETDFFQFLNERSEVSTSTNIPSSSQPSLSNDTLNLNETWEESSTVPDLLRELITILDESLKTTENEMNSTEGVTESSSSSTTENLNQTIDSDDLNETVPTLKKNLNLTDSSNQTADIDFEMSGPSTWNNDSKEKEVDLETTFSTTILSSTTDFPTSSPSSMTELHSSTEIENFNTMTFSSTSDLDKIETTSSSMSSSSSFIPDVEKSYEWTEEPILEVRIGPTENTSSLLESEDKIMTQESLSTQESSTPITTQKEIPISTGMVTEELTSTSVTSSEGTPVTSSEETPTTSEKSNPSEGGEVSYVAADEPKEETPAPSPSIEVTGDVSLPTAQEHSWLDLETTSMKNENFFNESQTSTMNLENTTAQSTAVESFSTNISNSTESSTERIRKRRGNRRWRRQ